MKLKPETAPASPYNPTVQINILENGRVLRGIDMVVSTEDWSLPVDDLLRRAFMPAVASLRHRHLTQIGVEIPIEAPTAAIPQTGTPQPMVPVTAQEMVNVVSRAARALNAPDGIDPATALLEPKGALVNVEEVLFTDGDVLARITTLKHDNGEVTITREVSAEWLAYFTAHGGL